MIQAIMYRRWKKFLSFLLLAISTFAFHRARADATADSVNEAELEQYEGVYRFGAYRELVVTVLSAGSQRVLMTADLQSDAIRILKPEGGPDIFTSGPEFARSRPIRARIRFIRDQRGTITALSRQLADSTANDADVEVARRIPYRTRAARFHNADVILNGSLITPSGPGPFPAVVFAHGSEASDRHSFGPTPLALVARGFAVLVYDKRGTGTSTGSWQDVGIAPIGEDLLAAVRFVSRQRSIDSSRVGVFGTSEGAWVAAYAAGHAARIAFVVTVSGGARTKADAYLHKIRTQAESMSAAPADSAIREAMAQVDSSRARAKRRDARGFDLRLSYDPTADWRKFDGPVLHLEGESDVLESGPVSASWYRDLHRSLGHRDATVKLFPRAHHSLIQAVKGTAAEFDTAEGLTQMATGYWDSLFRWLAEHESHR